MISHPVGDTLAATGLAVGWLGWVGVVAPVVALVVSLLAGVYYCTMIWKQWNGKAS